MTGRVRGAAVAPAMLVCVAVLAIHARTLGAQGLGWTAEAAASANAFWGNTSQRLVTSSLSGGHADSAFKAQVDGRFTYADATAEDQTRGMTRRSWISSVSFDHRPFARYSPFLFASAESSLENRIGLRVSGGIGAKRTFLRTEASELSLSLAVLGERTRLRDAPVTQLATTVARWSLRARARRRFDDRLSVSHLTFYRPALTTPGQFTLTSTSSLDYTLTRVVALTTSLVYSYDTEARARGAQSNADGQLVFGLRLRR